MAVQRPRGELAAISTEPILLSRREAELAIARSCLRRNFGVAETHHEM